MLNMSDPAVRHALAFLGTELESFPDTDELLSDIVLAYWLFQTQHDAQPYRCG